MTDSNYVVDLTALPSAGKEIELLFSETDRSSIATRLQIQGINELRGKVHVKKTQSGFSLRGDFQAKLIRECVASLESMEEEISHTISAEFLQKRPEGIDEMSEEERSILPDIHEEKTLDLEEFIVQELSLLMDPFPRKPGAEALIDEFGVAPESSPFDALAALTDPKKQHH